MIACGDVVLLPISVYPQGGRLWVPLQVQECGYHCTARKATAATIKRVGSQHPVEEIPHNAVYQKA